MGGQEPRPCVAVGYATELQPGSGKSDVLKKGQNATSKFSNDPVGRSLLRLIQLNIFHTLSLEKMVVDWSY